jgi:uncharacterized RmlC-like cupin family protein
MATNATPTCTVIHGGDAYEGKQGVAYFAGVSAQNAGAQGLCMHVIRIPPGGRAKPHLHAEHESIIYVISGEAETWYGEQLEGRARTRAGDFLYIPAGLPHMPVNRSQTEPCVAVVARTDPNEQESLVLLTDLEAQVARDRSSD